MIDQEKEILKLREALLKANKDIEKLSKIKSNFISLISHELRTPLTSIKESVSLILDGVVGPISDEQRKFLDIAKNNIDRLARLISDILDFSKIESGMVLMRKRKIDINELIKNIYTAMKTSVEQKGLMFSLELSDALEQVWLDPDRIGQVLRNLISNAVKFNRKDGSIKLSSSKENINGRDFIKISVEDTGIGIPQEELENLFKNFSPLDTSLTRKHSGAGLGLAISKGIIELHGGDIWVVSGSDSGSKFIFTIPIISLKKLLLIIDDEEDFTSMLSFRLKNMGFEVLTANNGDKGIELARANKPDIILLDLMMPNLDGFQVSQMLKNESRTKHIPIVVLTALTNENSKESLEKIGAVDFIEKPFEPDELLKKINNVLGGV